MKIKQHDIAHALVDVTQKLTPELMNKEIDAALAILHGNGSIRALRGFPLVLKRVLQDRGLLFKATLITPTGKSGPEAKKIHEILEKTLKRDIELEEIADPDMIGGAVLRVGDELFDLSIPGALTMLGTILSSFPHSSSTHESQ